MREKITALKVLCVLICLVMTGVTIQTSLTLNLFQVLPDMIRHPWMKATFIDFYFNILIIWSWVVYKERSFTRALAWLVAFTALGSIATSFYVLLQLRKWTAGDPPEKVLVRAD